LADSITSLFEFTPKSSSLDLKGGENSTRIIENLLTEESWLVPIHDALSTRKTPVKIFFRDDDAGWENEKLFELIQLFKKFNMPLDLAAIPKAMSDELAQKLQILIAENPQTLAIHQHGFSHTNHETEGRKCEFGISRNLEEQFADVSEGKAILESYLGDKLTSIFTPPWNRCTTETAKVLCDLGFKVLSRESGASALNCNRLAEISVSLNWFAKRKRVTLIRREIGENLAKQIAGNETIGIMLHHAIMDIKEFRFLEELLRAFSESENVKAMLMNDLAEKTLSANHA
jgi:predicted deacetylase